jgi:Ca-activated chloride channel homolog
MRHKKTTLSALVFVIAAVLSPAAASEPSATESISVDYVLVPFVAFARNGKPIQNLRSRDVQLYVDGARVQTDFFEKSHDAPVSFTILLDGSGSMGLAGKMQGARSALASLIRNPVPGDDYALYVFAEGDVRELVPFTSSGQKILDAVDTIEPWGRTALFDALIRMPDKTILGRNGTRAIILLSDGLDNASTVSSQQLTQILEGVSVPVFPLSLRSLRASLGPDLEGNGEAAHDLAVLAGVAGASGGRLAAAETDQELRQAVDRILRELRSQYLVGFSPSGSGEIRYRPISLGLNRPVSSIRVRGGYRGTAP